MKLGVALFALLSTMAIAQAPDSIYVNGNVYTGQRSGADIRRVQAFAVREGRITAVGTNDEVRKLKGGKTQVVDLGGRFVMPGFNDAHLHLAGGGFEKLNVDLVGTKSLAEMQQRIAERAKTTPTGEWMQGRGWDHTKWEGAKLPTRQDLDAATGGRPALFVRIDGHIAVANTAALSAAGINKGTTDPQGGKIDRDAQGEATGILREGAQELVSARMPAPTPSQRRKAIELALQEAAQWGITSIQDNSEWQDFLVYEELEKESKLTVRVCEWLPFEAPRQTLETHRAKHERGDAMLHTGLLKGFMDGSLGSRTAALLKPYSDDPQNSGLPQFEQAKLNAMARERIAARFQMGFHAIGDGAAEMALNAFADAEQFAERSGDFHHFAAHHPPASIEQVRADWVDTFRFRIEHAQVIAPEQFARFKELGVIASVQPNHLLTDMEWAESRIGPERAKTSYPWRQFKDAGVVLAFGTDYPVEPITPFRGLYAAVTRKNEAGTREYYPEQKIRIDDAIAAYTSAAAYAEFMEREKGMIAPDMLADFVVLDRDITKVPAPEILGTKVLKTVVGGKTVYEAGK